LVSWWPGDGNANDIVDGNAGTLEYGAAFGSGLVGQAFDIPKGLAAIVVPHNSNLDFSDFTFEAWVNLQTITPGADNYIIAKYDQEKNRNPSFYPYTGYILDLKRDTQQLDLTLENTAIVPLSHENFLSNSSVPVGTWTHVAVTRQGTQVNLYINGVLDGSGTTAAPGTVNTDPFVIGATYDTLFNPPFEPEDSFGGLIDEVSVYNRALSAAEIQAIFNAGSAGKCKPGAVPTPTPVGAPTPTPAPALPMLPPIGGGGGPIFPTAAPGAAIAIAPQALTFSPNPVGAVSAPQTVTVTNNGTASAHVASVAINSSDSFAEIDDCVGTLLPHASCTVQVVFAPTAQGEASGALQLVDDSQQDEAEHPQAAALTGTGTAGSGLTAAPAAMSFAAQLPGTVSAARQVRVTNNLGSAAKITKVAVIGDFSATSNCGTLSAGASCTISVTFAPDSAGLLSGGLTITSDSTRAPVKVALSGNRMIPATPTPRATATPVRTPRPEPTEAPVATPAPTPAPTATPVPTPAPARAALVVTPHKMSMGSEAVAQSAPVLKSKRVVPSNPKNKKQDATITIENVTAGGDFEVSGGSCVGPLAPGHKCAVSVEFAPSSSGAKSGTLTITSNASNGLETVTLEGKGR